MVDAVREVLEQRQAYEAEAPRPLVRPVDEPEPYPIEALGSLRSAATAIHEHTQAPIAICAQAVLGAAALVGQAHADVVLPTGQARPLSLFLLTIAASGDRKSAVDSLALKSIHEHEEQLRAAYRSKKQEYETAEAIWNAKRSQALADIKQSKKQIDGEADLRALGDAPEKPLIPLLVCPEPTFEGYCRLTAEGQPALGLYSAEGGSFIGGFGMSPDQRLKTAASLSSVWDGDPIKRVRAGDGTTILAGRRLSMHLMAQPDVASQLVNDEVLISQGLMSRMLVSAPLSTAGTRFYSEPSVAAKNDLALYHGRLSEFVQRHVPTKEGARNELEPRTLTLSSEAVDMWKGLYNFIEARLIQDGEFGSIPGLGNKAAEHAARLAGVLALWGSPDATQITAVDMANGAVLIQHYLAESLRLRDMSAVDPHLRLAQRVLDWLQTRWGEPAFYLAAIYNDCPIREVRNSKTARGIVTTLEEHGWLMRLDGETLIRGSRRREAWLIYGRSLP